MPTHQGGFEEERLFRRVGDRPVECGNLRNRVANAVRAWLATRLPVAANALRKVRRLTDVDDLPCVI